jgi:hypothetical protein
VSGNGCVSLAAKCGTWGSDFTTFNPKTNLCSTLKEGDYVCYSTGNAYTPPRPDAPKPNADDTCAAYLSQNTDICAKLAIAVNQIGSFNKGEMLESNATNCIVYKDPRSWDDSVTTCSIPCGPAIEAARAEGRTMNYSCGGHFPLTTRCRGSLFQGPQTSTA